MFVFFSSVPFVNTSFDTTGKQDSPIQVVLAREYFLYLEQSVAVVTQFLKFSFLEFARVSTLLWSSCDVFLV